MSHFDGASCCCKKTTAVRRMCFISFINVFISLNNLIILDMDGSSEHVWACPVHGAIPDRVGLGQPNSRPYGGWGLIDYLSVKAALMVCTYSYWFKWFQEPCIEEHCHDSWFPGMNLLSNLHHVINFVRVRVPETAPEVKRETPPSTSTEASSYGQVKKKIIQLSQNQEMHFCHEQQLI